MFVFLYVLCRMVLARCVGAETQLQSVTAGWWNQLIEKQWTVQFWSYDLISEVSTNSVFILTSRLCHVWLCDVASPIPSWHRLRRGGVTFRDATSWLQTYAERWLWRTVTVGPVKANFLLIYCDVHVCLVWNSGPFEIVYVRECRWRFDHTYYMLYWLWYILDWNFRDARGVYNGRLCGRSFSWTSGEVVAVRRVGVFVLVRFA